MISTQLILLFAVGVTALMVIGILLTVVEFQRKDLQRVQARQRGQSADEVIEDKC